MFTKHAYKHSHDQDQQARLDRAERVILLDRPLLIHMHGAISIDLKIFIISF